MILYNNNICNKLSYPKRQLFKVQNFGQFNNLLYSLYKNGSSFENVTILFNNYVYRFPYLNNYFYTIDNVKSYYRKILHCYCPCKRFNFLYEYNTHLKNDLRIRLKNLPLFALVFIVLFKLDLVMSCINPVPLTISSGKRDYKIYVPCGRCYHCQSQKRASFFLRCMNEFELSRLKGSCYFLTFTLKDCYLVSNKSKSFIRELWSKLNLLLNKDRSYDYFLLDKRLFSLFVRRFQRFLKTRFSVKPSYIYVGEYGTLNHRPHWHMLFFLRDLYIRYDYLKSILEKLWKYGSIDVQQMSEANINYVGKHSVKSDFGSMYQQRFSPSYIRYSLGNYVVGRDLIKSNLVNYLYKHNQKFFKLGKYSYYFPRFLTKKLHPNLLSDIELELLEYRTGEIYDKTMHLYGVGDEPIFIKSRLMSEDLKKRYKYEKFRILKKIKKSF